MHNSFIYSVIFLLVTCTFFSCNSLTDKNINLSASKPLFEYIQAEKTGVTFKNELIPSYEMNAMEYNYFYNGGGVAAADFNNDGLTDLYFTGNQVSGKLYLNMGDFEFNDVTVKAGLQTTNWCTGVAVADVNNDGLSDMYISYAGYNNSERRKNQLFINKGINSSGIPVFKDEAEQYGLADNSYTTQA
jgi:hypothetical protein